MVEFLNIRFVLYGTGAFHFLRHLLQWYDIQGVHLFFSLCCLAQCAENLGNQQDQPDCFLFQQPRQTWQHANQHHFIIF